MKLLVGNINFYKNHTQVQTQGLETQMHLKPQPSSNLLCLFLWSPVFFLSRSIIKPEKKKVLVERKEKKKKNIHLRSKWWYKPSFRYSTWGSRCNTSQAAAAATVVFMAINMSRWVVPVASLVVIGHVEMAKMVAKMEVMIVVDEVDEVICQKKL